MRPPIGSHRLRPAPAAPLAGAPRVGVPGAPIAVPVSLAMPPLPQPPVRVMPPQMPPLPALPPASPWRGRTGPSAALVQRQYVDQRLRDLDANRVPGKRVAMAHLEQMILNKQDPARRQQEVPAKELVRVYDAIERNLQSADLTINFQANAWFSVENPFDTYSQMYERAVVGGMMVLSDTDLNSAQSRADVDNQVTFAPSWSGGAAAPQRGLVVGPQSKDRIRAQMDTGTMTPVGPTSYKASNAHFNPKAKQVFLGLNYGRRPHGSAINFGASHFVLRPDLKPRCLYYAGDTFMYYGGGAHAGDLQVPFTGLGALMGKQQGGDFMLRDHIYQSCYEGRILSDPDSGMCKFLLIEAHHFGELRFRDHVARMIISPRDVDPGLWPTVLENARKFAQRHGIPIFQTD